MHVFCLARPIVITVETKWTGKKIYILTLVLLNPDIPAFANSVDPDQLDGSTLFVIKYVNLYQQPESSYLIG